MKGKKKLKLFFCFMAVVFCLSLAQYLYADELSELKTNVQALKEENRLLQEKLKNQESLIQNLSGRLDELELKEAEHVITEEKPLTSLPAIPQMEIKGFGDVSFNAKKADNRADANPSTFVLSELDFFITSQLSEKISLLNENVIEFEGTTIEIDVERLYLKYGLSDLLNIVAGRFHTPVGHWNTNFHHGKWFQTTDHRPLIVEYEHEAGIIPMHMVGIDFFGKKDIGLFDFEYNFAVGNGRANDRTKVQNHQDGNDAKAFNTRLALKPHGIPGLEFGFNAYTDKIPAAPTVANRNGEINEVILGGYFTWQKDKLEVLFEGYDINHKDELTQRDYKTTGLYLQGSYKLREKWTPYYRFDFLAFAQGDPYYSTIDIDENKHSLGLRWDLATWNALKLEYSYSDRKDASDKHAITFNDSFHF